MPGTKPGTAARTPKPAGKAPAWALKVGTVLATLSIFGGSFGYATAHLYVTDAPLQPATTAASARSSATTAASGTSTSSSTSRSTTTLGSSVRTTSRTPITTTRHS